MTLWPLHKLSHSCDGQLWRAGSCDRDWPEDPHSDTCLNILTHFVYLRAHRTQPLLLDATVLLSLRWFDTPLMKIRRRYSLTGHSFWCLNTFICNHCKSVSWSSFKRWCIVPTSLYIQNHLIWIWCSCLHRIKRHIVRTALPSGSVSRIKILKKIDSLN